MKEYERSYIFSADDWMHNYPTYDDVYYIEDYYLTPEIRFRLQQENGIVNKRTKCFFCRKEGLKSNDYREEHEEEISENILYSMKDQAKLVIKKDRYIVKSDDKLSITVDVLRSPMHLAILEIESKKGEGIKENDVEEHFFGKKWRSCPLSAFSFFNRKIGFCGGPSSGKTETAKLLSHVLNTKYNSNSWHVTEFASSFIQKYGRPPEFNDQFLIWFGQKERERAAEKANIVVSDCPTFLSYIYTLYLNKEKINPQTSLFMSKIYKRVLFDIQEYSDIIFLNVDKYVDNGIRYQTSEYEVWSLEQKIKSFLTDHQVPYTEWNKKDDINCLIKSLFYINQ